MVDPMTHDKELREKVGIIKTLELRLESTRVANENHLQEHLRTIQELTSENKELIRTLETCKTNVEEQIREMTLKNVQLENVTTIKTDYENIMREHAITLRKLEDSETKYKSLLDKFERGKEKYKQRKHSTDADITASLRDIPTTLPNAQCEELLNKLREFKSRYNIEKNNTINILPVSYTHLRAHETPEHLVCRLLLEKKKNKFKIFYYIFT